MITNKYGIPESVVNAIRNDTYRKCGDYTCTELVGPAWQAKLKREHAAELVEDASDRIWSLFGSAVHGVIERAKAINEINEVRLGMYVCGKYVTGQFDTLILSTMTLLDYKTCSVYNYINPKPEWEAQLNVLAEFVYTCMGLDVKALAVVTLLKDWRVSESMREQDYPPTAAGAGPVVIPMWPKELRRQYILDRLALHMSDDPPVCTPSERWEKQERWVIWKNGAKKGSWYFDDESAALAEFERRDLKDNYQVLRKPNKPKRCCDKYCSVTKWCSFYANIDVYTGGS